MTGEKQYWFYAKRRGWGWAASAPWQGWIVRIIYAALIGGGIRFVAGKESVIYFCFYVGALTVAAFGVCWWKGEPLRWRWKEHTPEPAPASVTAPAEKEPRQP